MSLGGLLNVATGVMGLLGAGKKNRAQEEAMAQAARMNGLKADGLERLMRLAGQYDPAQEDKAGIDYAASVTEDSMKRGLTGLNTDFRNAGGNPYGDTLFRAKVQGMTDRAYDPLRAKVADLATTRTQRKAGMLSQALGSGGDIAGNYLEMARANDSDPTAAMGLLSGGLAEILKRPAPDPKITNLQGRASQPEEGRISLSGLQSGNRYDTSQGRNESVRLKKVGRG